jgi:RHS repeat-associated protein
MSRRVVATLAAVAGFAVPVAAIAASGGSLASSSATDDPLANPGALMTAAELQAQSDKLEARRKSPEEVAARRESRTRFENLSDARAADLLRDHETPLAQLGAYRALDLPEGTTFKGFVNDRTARVIDRETPALVVSNVPMRTKDATGELRRVDLALDRKGENYALDNALVPIELPGRLADGIEFPDDGLILDVEASKSEALVERVGDTLVYPNSASDTDAVLKPVPMGLKLSWLVRSAKAPEEFRFSIRSKTAERKLELLQGKDQSGLAVVVDGDVTGLIYPPAAIDRDGYHVETAMRVEGNGVVVTAKHRQADVKYPLQIDPGYVDERDWTQTSDISNWVFLSSHPGAYSAHFADINDPNFNPGLWVGTYQGATYGASYGEWTFKAPRTSHIYRAKFYEFYHEPDGTSIITGLYAPNRQPAAGWEQFLFYRVDGGTLEGTGPLQTPQPFTATHQVELCAGSLCELNANEGTPGNVAVLGLVVSSTHTMWSGAFASIGAAEIYMYDNDFATVQANSGLPPTGWVDEQSFTLNTTVSDPGLGPAWAEFSYPFADASDLPSGDNDVVQFPDPAVDTVCYGPSCSTSLTGSFAAVSTADMPTGINTATLKGFDLTERPGIPLEFQIKVDHREPEIVIDGPLEAAPNTDTGDHDDPMPLTEASYNLNQIKALDNLGPENPAQSGPQRLTISLANPDLSNQNTLHNDTTPCPNNGCEKVGAGAITPANLPTGDRTLIIETVDGVASHLTLEQLKLLVPAGTLLTPASGQSFAGAIPLQAKAARSGPTGVTFKYRLGADPWQTIPANDVKRPNGQAVSSWPVSLTNGESELLSWDARATPGVPDDGPISVKATFSGSSNTGDTAVAEVTLDQEFVGSQYAAADVGPGQVTLIGGNHALASNDVSIDAIGGADLTVSRTYNSQSDTSLDGGPLGPGWTLGTPVLSANVAYTKLEVLGNGIVTAFLEDGTGIYFQPAGSNAFTSPDGFKSLVLKKVSSSPVIYTIDDDNGTQVRFDVTNQTTRFVPTSIAQGAGNGPKTVLEYETVGTVRQPKRVIAPRPTGLANDCRADPVPAGCRVLKFYYATTTPSNVASGAVLGDYEGRLVRVEFVAADPANGQVSPTDVARYEYDGEGRLRGQWDPRISPALKDRYDYDSRDIVSDYTPPGERPWHFTYVPLRDDGTGAKLTSVSRDALPSGTTTWTVAYDVPVTGAGAPYNLSATEVAKWGQVDLPTKGVAIFPPTQVPTTSPPSSYTNATIHYLDADANEVNTASPGGQIDTSEQDHHRNITRELTAANRQRALDQGANSAAASVFYDTRRTYNTDGTRLLDEFGPGHPMWVSGTTVDARSHTAYAYDTAGAPLIGGPYNLPTVETVSARVGNSDSDSRTTSYAYGGQGNVGWNLRQPTSTTVDPGGLNLTTRTTYDEPTGEVVQTRMPADATGTTAGTTNTVLYTADGSASVSTCRNNAAMAGRPCQDNVAAQPTGSSQPSIPLTAHVYDRLFNENLTITATGSTARYTGHNYDAAGRLTTRGVSSNSGTALPNITFGYNATTGRQTTATTSSGTITRAHDILGRLSAYTDATANQTTYGYDVHNRLTGVQDGKGTHGVGQYDLNERPTTITDTQLAAPITATYDADNRLLTQTLPNGIKATYSYDAAGNPTALTYEKTTNCSTNCTWLSFTAVYNAHGQVVRYTGTGPTGDQGYVYDNAGRLSAAVDIRAGQCTIRAYTYDANSNRTSERTIPPLGGGVCDFAGTGTTVSRTYDQADRLIGTGIDYDPLGNTLTLPALAAGGAALTASYFADNRVRSITQSGTTYTYTLDPGRRVLARGTTGSRTQHYGDDSDNPVWVGENVGESQYTRNIAGADGGLAAIYDSQTGVVTFQLADLHGDIAATAGATSTIVGLATSYDANEFGVPRTPSPRYGWLGADERTNEFSTGTMLMGDRVYQPHIGRFLQVDPAAGGSANDYDYANQDPLNQVDLDGRCAMATKCVPKIECTRGGCSIRCAGKGERKARKRLVSCVVRCNYRCPNSHPYAGDGSTPAISAKGKDKKDCMKNAKKVALQWVPEGCALKHCHFLTRKGGITPVA